MSAPAPPVPREHGAWGLLLQPFVAAAILSAHWTWLYLPGLGLILAGFLLREPLIVLARHLLVWRSPQGPWRLPAARWLAAGLAACALCAWPLFASLPPLPLVLYLALSGLFTLVAVQITIRNRQRSRLFQSLSAAVLTTTAPFAAFLAHASLPFWTLPLYLLLTAHAVASIHVVHTRLQHRIAARAQTPAPPSPLPQTLQLPLAALALLHPPLALPPVFSFLTQLYELRLLRSPAALKEPLTRVGLRTLALSITHKLLTIACLWRFVHR